MEARQLEDGYHSELSNYGFLYFLHSLGKVDHLPEIFYVDCRVLIPVMMHAAFRTGPFTDIQIEMFTVFHHMAAAAACLCRVL